MACTAVPCQLRLRVRAHVLPVRALACQTAFQRCAALRCVLFALCCAGTRRWKSAHSAASSSTTACSAARRCRRTLRIGLTTITTSANTMSTTRASIATAPAAAAQPVSSIGARRAVVMQLCRSSDVPHLGLRTQPGASIDGGARTGGGACCRSVRRRSRSAEECAVGVVCGSGWRVVAGGSGLDGGNRPLR